MTVIGRVDDHDGRYYEHPKTGAQQDSVTAIIGAATDKSSYLVPWSSKIAAQWCADHIVLVNDAIKASGPDAAVDLIKGAAGRLRDRAANIGTDVHNIAEALILNSPVLPIPHDIEDPELRAEIDNIAIGFVNFVQDFDPILEMAEATICDPILGIAGTGDLVAKMRVFGRLFIDIKTGRTLHKEMAAQVATYAKMKEVWLPMGVIAPMPDVDGCAILHLRPEFERGYKLKQLQPEVLDAAYEWFLKMLDQYKTGKKFKKMPVTVIYPPLADGSQPPPRLDDLEGHGRWPGVLIEAGFVNLDDVCVKSAGELKAIKGFGDKSLTAVLDMLGEYGLRLRSATERISEVA